MSCTIEYCCPKHCSSVCTNAISYSGLLSCIRRVKWLHCPSRGSPGPLGLSTTVEGQFSRCLQHDRELSSMFLLLPLQFDHIVEPSVRKLPFYERAERPEPENE